MSQRYVDESVAEYVDPDCIADDPELHQLWLEAVAACPRGVHEADGKAAQDSFKDEPDRTLRRKLARQAARSVLPNATETKIFVTANARALRHFIEMRASRYAEPKFASSPSRCSRSCRPKRRNLFGDYQLVPLPGRHLRSHDAASQGLGGSGQW